MGTVPANDGYYWDDIPPIYSDLQTATYDTTTFLLNPPMVRLIATAATSMASGSWIAVPWGQVKLTTETMWTSGTPTRITPKTPGWYRGWFTASWSPSSYDTTGVRQAALAKNGTRFLRRDMPASAATSQGKCYKGIAFRVPMNGDTDYLEVYQYQTCGYALTVWTAQTPEFSMRWDGAL